MNKLKNYVVFFWIAFGLNVTCFAQAGNSVANSCFEAIAVKPEVAPIFGKVAMKQEDFGNFSFLVNSEKVTNEQEKKAIGIFIEERKKCEAYMSSMSPEIAGHRKAQLTAIESAAADLYLGNITFGEFTKIRKQLSDSMASIINQYNSNLQAQAQAQEDARRQAILGLYFNRPNFQPTPLTFTPIQIPKTTTSNCNWIGGQLNCITR
jgi:hypothetical protein